ncbi:hypothetical protein CEP51_016557 [Fusarium floridanum]|uniref:Uncharacterized protein n=1 Tax=Fusarium floridanum TaxID=1325733 RepID=A0A428NLP2_9HYPO|nr:hypothetical protein CEP51_016557 [Fusarium floridanum]
MRDHGRSDSRSDRVRTVSGSSDHVRVTFGNSYIRTCRLRNQIKPTNAMEQRRHWIERCDACSALIDSTCDGNEET